MAAALAIGCPRWEALLCPYLPTPKGRVQPTRFLREMWEMSDSTSTRPNKDLAGSVTRWIRALQAPDNAEAQQEIWNRYFERLAGIARKYLPARDRRMADEEDVALSVLDSFFQGTRAGRYPRLSDRTQLWPLLARMAECKAIKASVRENALKRGGGRTVHADHAAADDREAAVIDAFAASGPSPQTAVELAETLSYLLDKLGCDTLRTIARRKLEGYRNSEIATELRVTPRTVERKLLRIRTLWLKEMEESELEPAALMPGEAQSDDTHNA